MVSLIKRSLFRYLFLIQQADLTECLFSSENSRLPTTIKIINVDLPFGWDVVRDQEHGTYYIEYITPHFFCMGHCKLTT